MMLSYYVMSRRTQKGKLVAWGCSKVAEEESCISNTLPMNSAVEPICLPDSKDIYELCSNTGLSYSPRKNYVKADYLSFLSVSGMAFDNSGCREEVPNAMVKMNILLLDKAISPCSLQSSNLSFWLLLALSQFSKYWELITCSQASI